MSKPAYFKFRLYVAGDGPNSKQAVANLKTLCGEHLAERHEIEIIDVFRDPQRALTDGVVLTPMLVKVLPSPVRKIIGCLSQPKSLLLALDLPEHLNGNGT
jgi:circadian clock protein KaiB